MNTFYEIVVGGSGLYDQPAGSTDFPIPSLAGVGGHLEKRGLGRVTNSEYSVLPGGGFSVPNATENGEVFYFIPSFVTGSTTTGWYTNGFNYPKVMTVLTSRIGWRGNVDVSLQQSRSGRYFDDGSFHPLVTIPNISETIEGNLSAEVQQLTRGSIISCLTKVFSETELVDNTLLFDRIENNSEIENGDKFVGVRFLVAPKFGLRINSIQLYFNQNITFNLYLYHETREVPIWQQQVTASANETVQVELSNELVLTYLSGDYLGGHFYLGYYQGDLGSARAIDEYGRKNKCKVVGFDFISADKTDTFDRKQSSLSNRSHGLNMEISTFKDHTESILKQAHLFDNAIGLQVAHNVVKQIIYSTRSNRTERMLKTDLDKMGVQYELNGAIPVSDVPKTFGLQDKINSELKRVKESFFPVAKAQSVSLC
ncbi:MAG: hypothetical protein KF862_07225 [Chitinophagaceae bacterium]|nr:hypothetical protein [Chitinophagaceae bacterium]